MPEKVSFHVAHASGQDENFRAAELNTHSPLTRGWSSSRYVRTLSVLRVIMFCQHKETGYDLNFF